MKRTNIEFMIGWLDALRRDDVEALEATLEPEIVWQGLREEWSCHGADSVVDTFASERDARAEIDAIELIGAEDHAILHAHGAGLTAVEDLPTPRRDLQPLHDRGRQGDPHRRLRRTRKGTRCGRSGRRLGADEGPTAPAAAHKRPRPSLMACHIRDARRSPPPRRRRTHDRADGHAAPAVTRLSGSLNGV